MNEKFVVCKSRTIGIDSIAQLYRYHQHIYIGIANDYKITYLDVYIVDKYLTSKTVCL